MSEARQCSEAGGMFGGFTGLVGVDGGRPQHVPRTVPKKARRSGEVGNMIKGEA